MNIKEKQRSAKQIANFLKDRNTAQAGFISIIYKNENGESATGYINFLSIELEVDNKTMTVGEMFSYMMNDIAKKEELIKGLQNAYGLATIELKKAQATVANMEKYMPTDYVGV